MDTPRVAACVFADDWLEKLSAAERVEIFEHLNEMFCFGCGRKQPTTGRWCQCENDE